MHIWWKNWQSSKTYENFCCSARCHRENGVWPFGQNAHGVQKRAESQASFLLRTQRKIPIEGKRSSTIVYSRQ